MKKTLSYIAAAFVAASAMTGCDDNFATPPAILPPTIQVEETLPLADIKAEYWSTMTSPATIGFLANGDSAIFVGRVCSSDEAGNVYKNVIVQSVDENGEQIAVTLSINGYDLYQTWPYGQQVAVYATGMQIGGYHNLLQFGAANGTEMTFMDQNVAMTHIFRANEPLPQPDKVVTTVATIDELTAAKADQASLMRWQSRLIRVEGVSFEDAGQPCAEAQTVNRYVTDANGNRLNVRMSAYASFKSEMLPYGKGNVTGILSYYNNDWQVIINNYEDLADFDGVNDNPNNTPAEPKGDGTLESPYNVAKALELIKAGNITQDNVYVSGVIKGIRELDTSSYGNATYTIQDKGVNNEFLIYRGYYLDGAKFTSEDQIKAGDEVVVYGQLINFMNNTPEMTQGNYIVSINGNKGEDPNPNPTPNPGEGEGEGTLENPYNVAKTLDLINSGNITEDKVYVKGQIQSIKEVETANYGNASYYICDAGVDNKFYIFRGYYFNGEKFTATDQIKVGDEVVVYGQLVNYMGNTPEMAQGGYIVSLNGQTAPDPTPTPDPEPTPDPDPEPNPDPTPSGDAVSIAATSLTLPGSTTISGYTINIQQASGATAPTLSGSEARTYADNTITISGAGLTKIVFTIAASNSYRYTTLTPSTGTISPAQAEGDTSVTWIGNASEVTFTVGHDATLGSDGASKRGQIRFTQLDITGASAASAPLKK